MAPAYQNLAFRIGFHYKTGHAVSLRMAPVHQNLVFRIGFHYEPPLVVVGGSRGVVGPPGSSWKF